MIRYCFGEGVEPLAFFGLPDMDEENAQELRESAGFLADRGVRVDAGNVAERLGVPVIDGEGEGEVLQPINQAAHTGGSPEAEAMATENAKAARLERLVEETLRTANAPFDPEKHPRGTHGYFAEAEAARGRAAMRTALDEKTDVINAIQHPVLGGIDFRHGTPGDAARNFKGGFGVAHIAAKHREGIAMQMPEVIIHGKIEQGETRTFVEHGEHRVVLSKNWNGTAANRWLVTAYEKKEGNR